MYEEIDIWKKNSINFSKYLIYIVFNNCIYVTLIVYIKLILYVIKNNNWLYKFLYELRCMDCKIKFFIHYFENISIMHYLLCGHEAKQNRPNTNFPFGSVTVYSK